MEAVGVTYLVMPYNSRKKKIKSNEHEKNRFSTTRYFSNVHSRTRTAGTGNS